VTVTTDELSTMRFLRIFTAQCTLVQSAVLRSHVVRQSVCDVSDLWSHRLKILETKTNCTSKVNCRLTHSMPGTPSVQVTTSVNVNDHNSQLLHKDYACSYAPILKKMLMFRLHSRDHLWRNVDIFVHSCILNVTEHHSLCN